MIKICIKKTKEIPSEKLIEELKNCGGINLKNYKGTTNGIYYIIDEQNNNIFSRWDINDFSEYDELLYNPKTGEFDKVINVRKYYIVPNENNKGEQILKLLENFGGKDKYNLNYSQTGNIAYFINYKDENAIGATLDVEGLKKQNYKSINLDNLDSLPEKKTKIEPGEIVKINNTILIFKEKDKNNLVHFYFSYDENNDQLQKDNYLICNPGDFIESVCDDEKYKLFLRIEQAGFIWNSDELSSNYIFNCGNILSTNYDDINHKIIIRFDSIIDNKTILSKGSLDYNKHFNNQEGKWTSNSWRLATTEEKEEFNRYEEKFLKNQIDWNKFKRKATMKFIQGALNNQNWLGKEKELVDHCEKITEELIKKLKE